MHDREDPNIVFGDLEDDPVLADPQLPVAAERATEWCAKARGLRSQSCVDHPRDTPTGIGGNPRQVIAHRRVIAEGVGHSAFLGATLPPNLFMREPG